MPARDASAWARAVVRALDTPWPWAPGHVATGPDDCDVSPTLRHPAFHGCLDWHSSVHMQWSALTLLEQGHVDAAGAAELVARLDERLTVAHCAVEAAHLRARPGFERPYGWAWVATLAAAAAASGHPRAGAWAAAVRPVADVVFDHTLAWLPRLAYPVRAGAHGNTAFALGLLHDAATALGRPDVVDAIGRFARDAFADDVDYPAAWEPGGADFLSGALCEATLLRRVLPAAAFPGWLSAFLPGLGAPGDGLLEVPRVLDPADGHAVHLYGLALSRAWHLRELVPFLPDDRAARATAAASGLVAAVAEPIVAGDFMATHWLVTFALMAERAAS